MDKNLWEEYYLKDISLINPKTDDLPDLFNYIDLESVDSGILKIRKIISKEEAPSRAKRVLSKEDILFQTVRPYQKNNLFFDFEDMDYVASTGYAQIRAKDFIYPMFLYYLLHTDKFVNHVLARCTGTSYPAINSNDLKKIKVKIPNLKSQQKIGKFLFILDKKIELLEKTLVLYQKHLESLRLDLMHNNDNVIHIKLKDICKVNKGKQLNKSNMIENGKYYVLNGGKEPSGFTNSWNVKENTITISEGGNSCGFVSFNTEKFYCGGHCYYLYLMDSNVNLNYLFNYLKSIERKIMNLRVGSGLPNIQKGDVENINLNLPNLKEQEKIGDLLELLNSQIELKTIKLTQLLNFKKGLLQKMFI